MAVTKTRKSAVRPKPTTAGRGGPIVVRSGKVARWGNSLAFRIPQEIVERLKLTDGGEVGMEVWPGSFTVTPVRKKWTEGELLNGVTRATVGGEIDWVAGVE